MSEKSQNHPTCQLCSRNALKPWLAVLAAAGVTTAVVLIARQIRHSQVAQSVEDLLQRCDDAASALDARTSGKSLSLAG